MTDGERARELMVRLYNFLDCEPGDDGEILFQLKDAFAAVREECAKICEEFDYVNSSKMYPYDQFPKWGNVFAKAIRTGEEP